MAGSLTDLYVALNSVTQALNKMNTIQSMSFPQTTGISSFITNTGTAAINSSLPVNFLVVTTASGASIKIPYFT